MSGARVLVGTRKGDFVLESDGKRAEWTVSGPHFGGGEIYHLKGSPVQPNRLYASQTSSWFGQLIQRSDDGGKTWETSMDSSYPSPRRASRLTAAWLRAEDVKVGRLTSFPRSVKLKRGETVVFWWIVFKSRAHRDAVNAKVMADPRLKMMDPAGLPPALRITGTAGRCRSKRRRCRQRDIAGLRNDASYVRGVGLVVDGLTLQPESPVRSRRGRWRNVAR